MRRITSLGVALAVAAATPCAAQEVVFLIRHAETLGAPTKALPPDDLAGVLDAPSFDHEAWRVLGVGHNETIPRILSGLGSETPPDMADDEFGRIFEVYQ